MGRRRANSTNGPSLCYQFARESTRSRPWARSRVRSPSTSSAARSYTFVYGPGAASLLAWRAGAFCPWSYRAAWAESWNRDSRRWTKPRGELTLGNAGSLRFRHPRSRHSGRRLPTSHPHLCPALSPLDSSPWIAKVAALDKNTTQACSSVGEHYLDTVGVGGSIPPMPTNPWSRPGARCYRAEPLRSLALSSPKSARAAGNGPRSECRIRG
jgi:hypothetical protein